MLRRWLAESDWINCEAFSGDCAVNIGQAAYRVAVAAVHTQRLVIVTLRRGVIFARRGRIAQPQHRVAVGIVDVTRLLIERSAWQGFSPSARIALLDQQPVAVNLQQAVPFAPIIALGSRAIAFSNCATARARSPFWE
jgi:hypothetical protein